MFGGYIFYWGAVWRAMPELLSGLLVTIEVAILSVTIALALGVVIGFARASRKAGLSVPASLYIEAMRNSPSLVKMYFIFFGLPTLGLFPGPFIAGVIALSLHNAAYVAEIFRGGLLSVQPAQLDAARSLGMGLRLTFTTVLFPQAFRNSLPALSNNWVEIVKDTSLTSAVAVPELFYMTTKLVSQTQRGFEFLAVTAIIYLALCTVLSGALRVVEARTRYRRTER